MFCCGSILVWKNTPAPPEGSVRFSPPTAPDRSAGLGETGEVNEYVCGLGLIEPSGEAISVGTQLSGIVFRVHVESGMCVEAGDPLIQLDDRTAKADVEVAKAQVLGEEARLKELISQIEIRKAHADAALAELHFAEASLAHANQELERSEALEQKGAVSDEEAELKRLNRETERSRLAKAKATVRETTAELNQLQSDGLAPTIAVQQAAIAQAGAKLQRVESLLSQHTIRAPKACTVLQVRVHPGEFLPASILNEPLVVLGVMSPLHVRVDIDEADIPRFSETAAAWASVRGRSQFRVPLTFVKTEPLVIPKSSLSGAQRERIDTRVMQVIYAVAPADVQATAGQQVDVYIEVTKHSAVVPIPAKVRSQVFPAQSGIP
jgi:multidrug resistance efflux pump